MASRPMTSNDAETKWCPFAWVSNFSMYRENDTRVNRTDDNRTKCLGDSCMAWKVTSVERGCCTRIDNE